MAVNLDQTKGIRDSREGAVSRPERVGPRLVRPVLIALAVAAVLELLLWRTFSRIGIFIPKKETFQAVYSVLTQVGVVVLNFAVVLGVVMLVLSLGRLRELGRFGQRSDGGAVVRKGRTTRLETRSVALTVAVVGIMLVLGLTFIQMALVQNLLVSFLLRVAQIVAFTALAVDYWQSSRGWQARWFIGLLLTGYVVQITAKLILDYPAQLAGWNWLQNLYLPMLMFGEGAVLLNGIGLYLNYGGGGERPARSMVRNWPALLGAVGLAGGFLALTFLTVAESDIVPILGLYALGYTMQLPLALYVIALFFLLYTVFFNLGHLRLGTRERAAAFGLILIFTGGYLFNISNQYLFALIGVLLLARPEILEEW